MRLSVIPAREGGADDVSKPPDLAALGAFARHVALHGTGAGAPGPEGVPLPPAPCRLGCHPLVVALAPWLAGVLFGGAGAALLPGWNGRALDDLSALTGQPCTHFAWGNGTPRHLSDAAIAYLHERGVTVYSSVRGMNVPGTTPTLLLRDSVGLPPLFPEVWTRLLLLGGVDHRYLEARENLARRGGRLPAGARR